jgi:hypothetical protein
LIPDIVTVWRPLAESKIQPLIESAERNMASLGPDPADMRASDLLSDIAAQMKDKWIATPAAFDAPVTRLRNSKSGAAEAFEIENRFISWMSEILDVDEPGSILGAAELRAVVESSFTDTTNLKASRFVRAKELVYKEVMAVVISHVLSEAVGIKARAKDSLRRALCSSGSVAAVAEAVVTEVLYFCIFPSLAVPGRLALDAAWRASHKTELLMESEQSAAQRRAAVAVLAQYRESLQAVRTIDQHMNRTAADAEAGAI